MKVRIHPDEEIAKPHWLIWRLCGQVLYPFWHPVIWKIYKIVGNEFTIAYSFVTFVEVLLQNNCLCLLFKGWLLQKTLFPRGAHLAVAICIKVGISAMENGWVFSDDLFFNACCLKDDHSLLCHGGLCPLHHNIHSVQQFLIIKLSLVN